MVAVAWYSTKIEWWAPLLAVPLFWQVWDAFLGRIGSLEHLPIQDVVSSMLVQKRIADALCWLAGLGYISMSVWLIGMRQPNFCGWLGGLILGLLVVCVLRLLRPGRWREQAEWEKSRNVALGTEEPRGRS